jgi:hypothetical protein
VCVCVCVCVCKEGTMVRHRVSSFWNERMSLIHNGTSIGNCLAWWLTELAPVIFTTCVCARVYGVAAKVHI